MSYKSVLSVDDTPIKVTESASHPFETLTKNEIGVKAVTVSATGVTGAAFKNSALPKGWSSTGTGTATMTFTSDLSNTDASFLSDRVTLEGSDTTEEAKITISSVSEHLSMFTLSEIYRMAGKSEAFITQLETENAAYEKSKALFTSEEIPYYRFLDRYSVSQDGTVIMFSIGHLKSENFSEINDGFILPTEPSQSGTTTDFFRMRQLADGTIRVKIWQSITTTGFVAGNYTWVRCMGNDRVLVYNNPVDNASKDVSLITFDDNDDMVGSITPIYTNDVTGRTVDVPVIPASHGSNTAVFVTAYDSLASASTNYIHHVKNGVLQDRVPVTFGATATDYRGVFAVVPIGTDGFTYALLSDRGGITGSDVDGFVGIFDGNTGTVTVKSVDYSTHEFLQGDKSKFMWNSPATVTNDNEIWLGMGNRVIMVNPTDASPVMSEHYTSIVGIPIDWTYDHLMPLSSDTHRFLICAYPPGTHNDSYIRDAMVGIYIEDPDDATRLILDDTQDIIPQDLQTAQLVGASGAYASGADASSLFVAPNTVSVYGRSADTTERSAAFKKENAATDDVTTDDDEDITKMIYMILMIVFAVITLVFMIMYFVGGGFVKPIFKSRTSRYSA